ncbi:MAG: nuclear transport factor 2 family protein [Acidimicrobiia bacterium]
MTHGVIERFLRSLVGHDWSALEACLADDFTRVGPYGDAYSSKADYLAFLSDLMPRLAGYEMQVARVSYADGAERHDRRRADQPRRGVHQTRSPA